MLRYFTLLDFTLLCALLYSFTRHCTNSFKECTHFAQNWHTRALGPRNLPPKTPKWPQSPLEVIPMLLKWTKVTALAPKVSPRSPKVSQRWSQVVPQGLPRPSKIDQKRSPRPARDTFKKMNVSKLREPHYLLCFWSGLVREPHYLLCFKHIENPYFSEK